jgi:hypothetical protein
VLSGSGALLQALNNSTDKDTAASNDAGEKTQQQFR